MFALVDVNSFYASCEAVFRPDLRDAPIVVLSNNDGCIIARNARAKQLGIAMGTPYFKVKAQLRAQGVQVFSSNYTLYGDLSRRVMNILAQFAPVEVYSIDEAFLDLQGLPPEALATLGQRIQTALLKQTGLPVGVGIGRTRTLAKLANFAAKHYPKTGGVVFLNRVALEQRLLAKVPVAEVWGVGRKLSQHLNALGIHTAQQLATQPNNAMKKAFSVVLERTVQELNGISCIDIISQHAKHSIVYSRSFGHNVNTLCELQQAQAHYCAKAMAKLRKAQLHCQFVLFFAHGSRFDGVRSNISFPLQLPEPTQDTVLVSRLLANGLKRQWQGGEFVKCGVLLSQLCEHAHVQYPLFPTQPDNSKLMTVVDELNARYHNKMQFAATLSQGWKMKQNFLSPRYTTRWSEIPQCRIT
ncbi:Y-family DNA polymerase [Pasteurellaceae bacterium TAE3-ERU1]|nr:Y-family DNA polymerase [Pasteurellaceae bacterium TAE3-ERU1]